MPPPTVSGNRLRNSVSCVALLTLALASTLLAQHPPRDTIPANPARAFFEAIEEQPINPARIDRALFTIERAVALSRDCAEHDLLPHAWNDARPVLGDRTRWRIRRILERSHNDAVFEQFIRETRDRAAADLAAKDRTNLTLHRNILQSAIQRAQRIKPSDAHANDMLDLADVIFQQFDPTYRRLNDHLAIASLAQIPASPDKRSRIALREIRQISPGNSLINSPAADILQEPEIQALYNDLEIWAANPPTNQWPIGTLGVLADIGHLPTRDLLLRVIDEHPPAHDPPNDKFWPKMRRICRTRAAMIDIQQSIPAMLESLSTPGSTDPGVPADFPKHWLLHRALERGATRDQCRDALLLLFQRAKPTIQAARAKLSDSQKQYIQTFNYGIAQDLLHHVQITAIDLGLLTKQEVLRHHFPAEHPRFPGKF